LAGRRQKGQNEALTRFSAAERRQPHPLLIAQTAPAERPRPMTADAPPQKQQAE